MHQATNLLNPNLNRGLLYPHRDYCIAVDLFLGRMLERLKLYEVKLFILLKGYIS